MPFNCLIVDDEPLAHKVLENYIAKLDYLSLAGNAYTAFEALNFLQTNAVDILFLDIEMPELTGLDMLKTLTQPPAVILTTAYSEFALEGYDLGVTDYLLKPIRFERFAKAVQRIAQMAATLPQTGYSDFFVKIDGAQHRIAVDKLLYVEACGNFVKLHFADRQLLTAETMAGMETRLTGGQFVRVHRSFMVNVTKVTKVDGNIIYIEKQEIPIGASYKAGFLAIINK
jgi:two-component system, LytTR family, response regulator